jgi:hypothetical protein
MPSGHDKATKSLLQQPPPSNFKIKRSSTCKPSPGRLAATLFTSQFKHQYEKKTKKTMFIEVDADCVKLRWTVKADAHLKEGKVEKCHDPSIGLAQPLKNGSATPDIEEEEVHCKSAVEALKEWHNSGRITTPPSGKSKPLLFAKL